MVEGIKLIDEALRAGLKPASIWTEDPELVPYDMPCFHIHKDLYRAVSPTRSGRSVLATFPAPEMTDLVRPEPGRYLLLDQIQEPGNAGALVRAAAAFGFDGVLWHKPCVYPYNHAAVRASAGSVFHMAQHLVDERLDTALPVLGTGMQGAVELGRFQWPEHFILTMGNEGRGLSETMAACLTTSIRIEVSDAVESLNVAGAAHILMNASYRSRVK